MVLVVAGLVFAGLAAVVHVFIFYLESLAWTSPRARGVFGLSAEQAAQTRELAFNQGFYNLFLAVSVLVGLVFLAVGSTPVGATLVLVGAGSMFLAAVVLFVSSPDKRGAALKQGVVPLLGIVLLAAGLAI